MSRVTGRLFETLSPGYGYTAIAVALLARLHPLAVIPSAILFGVLEAGGGAMQRSAGVPAVARSAEEGGRFAGIGEQESAIRSRQEKDSVKGGC